MIEKSLINQYQNIHSQIRIWEELKIQEKIKWEQINNEFASSYARLLLKK